jgi:hypothetical protein
MVFNSTYLWQLNRRRPQQFDKYIFAKFRRKLA